MVDLAEANLTNEKVDSNLANVDLADHSIMLPNNCLPLKHQVAGHFFGKGRTKLGKFCRFN
jgi:hypothetical protein